MLSSVILILFIHMFRHSYLILLPRSLTVSHASHASTRVRMKRKVNLVTSHSTSLSLSCDVLVSSISFIISLFILFLLLHHHLANVLSQHESLSPSPRLSLSLSRSPTLYLLLCTSFSAHVTSLSGIKLVSLVMYFAQNTIFLFLSSLGNGEVVSFLH